MVSKGGIKEGKSAAKRLATFHRDSLKACTSVGFKHFDIYARGREEILVVVHQPKSVYPVTRGGSVDNLLSTSTINASLFDLNNMENLSTLRVRTENAEPPASPQENEIYEPQIGDTAFLIGSYQRYKRPLVWLRSHHDHVSGDSDQTDLPMDLKSTAESRWATRDVKLWEIISELVGLCMSPPPMNPLSIDRDFFEAAHGSEAALTSGAIIKVLEGAFINKNSEKFRHKIYIDLMYLRRVHFQGLLDAIRSQEEKTKEGDAVRKRNKMMTHSVETLNAF